MFYVCFAYTNNINSKIVLFFWVRNSDSATELLGTFLFEGVTMAAEKAQLLVIWCVTRLVI